MQDRSPPTRQIFLLRTAGPYIWVQKGHLIRVHPMSALPPKADIDRHEGHRLFRANSQD